MSKRTVFAAAGGALAIVAIAFAGWYFRPWSEYSPAKVIASSGKEDRVPIYRAMDDYFPYREIAGADEPTVLPRDLQAVDISYTHNGEMRTLDDYAADYAITGLMIVKDGTVVMERYWRGESADDLHASWSVAKSFISTLIGIALEEGKIASLDDLAEVYAPIYAGTDYGSTTIRDLLAMSSGINFEEDYEIPGSDIRALFFNTYILNRDIDRSVRKFERGGPAGADFVYQSTNSSVLGAVVSGAYGGTPLAEIASEKIFVPAGMSGGTWSLDRNSDRGKELAYCCMNIPLEDYAKFGLLYLNGGQVNGQRVFSSDWPKFVATPARPDAIEVQTRSGRPVGYGHHFWTSPDSDGAYFAAGYNGQFVWIDPATNVVLAMTSADTKYPGTNDEVLALHHAAVAAAAALQK